MNVNRAKERMLASRKQLNGIVMAVKNQDGRREREREKKKENRTREHIEKEEQETKGKFVLIQLALDL